METLWVNEKEILASFMDYTVGFLDFGVLVLYSDRPQAWPFPAQECLIHLWIWIGNLAERA